MEIPMYKTEVCDAISSMSQKNTKIQTIIENHFQIQKLLPSSVPAEGMLAALARVSLTKKIRTSKYFF